MEAVATTTKEVTEVHVHIMMTSTSTLLLALFILLHTFCTLFIVYLSLLRIRESLVGICNLSKFLLCCFLIITILVRMISDSQLLERLLNLLRVRVPFDSHHAVVVISWVRRFLSLLLATKAASTAKELFISSETATKVLLSLSTSVGMNRLYQSQTSIAHDL